MGQLAGTVVGNGILNGGPCAWIMAPCSCVFSDLYVLYDTAATMNSNGL